jgi:inner membrane protein
MLFEKLTKTRLHALQYLLVGLAMILFYVLLLSISEYLSFELAYGIASIATIGLIGLYSLSLFEKKLYSIILAVSLLVLYGFLFFLLQAKDYSLLIGSISLFSLLALFMYLTRNINKQDPTVNNTK